MKAILALAGICSLALISIVRTDGMDACTAKHSELVVQDRVRLLAACYEHEGIVA